MVGRRAGWVAVWLDGYTAGTSQHITQALWTREDPSQGHIYLRSCGPGWIHTETIIVYVQLLISGKNLFHREHLWRN